MDGDRFREVMSAWPAGVTLVACRVDGRVVATTVSAFLSLSLNPPAVLVAIGPNATVRPFLVPGALFGISVLAAAHRRLATVYADPYPVGPDPFGEADPPLLPDALVALSCRVTEVRDGFDHALVIAEVVEAVQGTGTPLLRQGRRYHAPDL